MDHAQLYQQLWVSAVMIGATTFVHGLFVASAAVLVRTFAGPLHGLRRYMRDAALLVTLGLWLTAAHVFEIAMWAWLYLRYDLFDGWEPALYFAAACFTTLGFGDLLLPEAWRLLSGATAANGFLLFGLSAAFLFDAVGKFHLAGGGPGKDQEFRPPPDRF